MAYGLFLRRGGAPFIGKPHGRRAGGALPGGDSKPTKPGAPTIAVVEPITNPPRFTVTHVTGQGAPLDTANGDIIDWSPSAPQADFSVVVGPGQIALGESNVEAPPLSVTLRQPYARIRRLGTPDEVSDWAEGPAYTVPALPPDIVVTDLGDASPNTGHNTASHHFHSQSVSGPHTVFVVSWHSRNGGLNSATLGGNALTILRQAVGAGFDEIRSAILLIAGAHSGTLSLHFNAPVAASHLTKLRLTGLQSAVPVATDIDTPGIPSNTITLALASPGVGGVRIGAMCTNTPNHPGAWTNAVEVSDQNFGSTFRHYAAYDLGDDGTDISATNNAGGGGVIAVGVGVSLR